VVGKILENPEKEKQMKLAALKFAKPEAAKLVAEDIISFVTF
jgi:UDP-N-acetylglucosamine:LPS N-acetylglucosamine transferase